MIPNYRTAIVKWNGGRGALLCNRCRTIIREGFWHADVEHFCGDCSGLSGSGDFSAKRLAGRKNAHGIHRKLTQLAEAL